MVEYTLQLDSIFGSLADPTRRDILRRVSKRQLTVTEVAHPYEISLAAISKHLRVLENAKLINKRKQGKEHYVSLAPSALKDANDYLKYYQKFMEANLDSLEEYLKKGD